MKKYDHLFFDLDRTLWDFEANSEVALRGLFDVFELRGRGVENFEDFLSTYKQINEACWAKYRMGEMDKETLRVTRFLDTFKKYGLDDRKLAIEFGDGYIAESPRQKGLKPGTIETLDYLAEKYVLHIITNGFKEVQHIKMENCGLTPYFSEIIISEEVGEKKPHPRVFNSALDRAKTSSKRSVMVGDDLIADVGGARNAGWDQVFYNPDEVRHSENITFEIRHLNELTNIL
ncbi:YjjG family noncanonical pyrimidine nucleotidase [Halocola ammonii]